MFETNELLHRGYKASADFTLPGAQAHYPPDLEIEPRHLDIALRIDIDKETATGTVTHTLQARRSGPRELTLHAVDFEDLSVRDADGREVSHSYDGKQIRIRWDEAFAEGEERKLAISYHVEKPATGLLFSHPLPDYPDRPRWAGTDHETERARHWLPTIDLPNARPTLEFHLTAAKDLTILANGSLVSEQENKDGTKTAHWKLEQPCPSYLTCFAIGDFVRYDDGEFEGRPLSYFTTREHTAEDLHRSFGRTGAMLEWMTKKLGYDFPYPKYFQFAVSGIGGAMENISLVSWEDMFVLDETFAKEWTWQVDQINVHEMAHSYFGDLIVCRDYAHAWLKESWAVYVESLWLEHSKGADERDYDVYTNINTYLDEADNAYKRPIVTRQFNHSWQMYDRHLYPGGGARLHMLRHELGDETFFRAVQDYVRTYAFQVVETDDFRRILEKHSGRSLGKWFDQWIHSKGYPHLKVSSSYDAKQKEIAFDIEQAQIDEKEGIPCFEMSLDLGWVVDGALATRRVKLEKAKHSFVFKADKEPEQLRVDPFMRAVMKLEFNPGDDKLKKQLVAAEEVVSRIRAAAELCKTGKRKNIEAVRDAYRNEKFWGVRVRFAEALGGAGCQAAVEALVELVKTEQDPMVLEPLIRHAGKYRDELIRQAVETRLDKGLDLYRARQAAFEVLGAQRDKAPYDRLLKAAETAADRYGWVQSGAMRALAATRRPEAVEALLRHTESGPTSNRVRPAAATALGSLGRLMDKRDRERIAERLEDVLRDPVPNVRKAGVPALSALQEPRGIGALEAFKATVSDQEKVGVDRAVSGIRAALKPKEPAKDKDLDELREKVRKLEDSLEKVQARLKPADAEGEKKDATRS